MLRKIVWISLSLVLVYLLGLWKGLQQSHSSDTLVQFKTRRIIQYVQTKASKEKPNQKERVEMYVPPEGHIEITPKDRNKSLDELVEVKRKWYGLSLRPGFGFLAKTDLPLLLDFKVAYLGRLGLTTGISVSGQYGNQVAPILGAVYHLDGISKGWLINTEAGIFYAPLSIVPWSVGLRWNL